MIDTAYIAYSRRLDREALERWLELDLDESVPECCREWQTKLRQEHVPEPKREVTHLMVEREVFRSLPPLVWSPLLGWLELDKIPDVMLEPVPGTHHERQRMAALASADAW